MPARKAADLSFGYLFYPPDAGKTCGMEICVDDAEADDDSIGQPSAIGAAGPTSLLAELDARQDELLSELENSTGGLRK